MKASSDQNIVKGRQRNHEEYHRPVSIRHLECMSLYRAVAWWGYYLGREFNRNDVSLAFRIEPRRASAILNYLCYRHDSNDMSVDFHKIPVKGGHRQLSVQIRAISDNSRIEKKEIKERNTLIIDKPKNHQMARWFLSRPALCNSDNVAAWKAACPASEESSLSEQL